VAKIKAYAKSIEEDSESNYTVAEVFPEFAGKEKVVALRAYRNREDLTQRQLAELTGIPQRHLSEMENGKRPIGKENTRKIGQALDVDYRYFL
jgi:DNA-binding XRE family transcriptional regulator